MFQILSTLSQTNYIFILSKYCQRSSLWLLFTSTLTSTWRYRVIQDQGIRKPLKTVHVATGMSIVYQLTTWLRLPKLKLTKQTQFDSSVIEGDRSFQLNGYTYLEQIIQAIQNEEVFVSAILSQCIICKVSLRNCKGYIGVVYRSPIQNNAEFENFLSDFGELLSKTTSSASLFNLILGDFSARSSSWWKRTKQQLKVHMWKPLLLCITFINSYQNLHTCYLNLIPVLI